MMCWFLLYSEVSQLYVYIYPFPLGPPLPSSPLPASYRDQVELSVLYSSFPLAIYMWSILISQFVLLCPPSPVHMLFL